MSTVLPYIRNTGASTFGAAPGARTRRRGRASRCCISSCSARCCSRSDHFIAGRADDPHTIIVDASVDQHARDVFKQARGRDPNADELYSLRRVWLDNEVLYREGLAMQLDKGDPAIRDRVIFKALSMIDASLKAAEGR